MQNVQKGFTLIELVVVIVLLGILGVTALAKFQDLSGDAQDAANAGVAAELSSGASINYAAFSLGTAGAASIGAATTCASAASSLMAVVPSDYTFADNTACGGAGGTTTCDVTHTTDGGTAGTAILLCTVP